MHMSKQGVYDQLTSEYGETIFYSAAQYTIDNIRTVENANALESKVYQDTMSICIPLFAISLPASMVRNSPKKRLTMQ